MGAGERELRGTLAALIAKIRRLDRAPTQPAASCWPRRSPTGCDQAIARLLELRDPQDRLADGFHDVAGLVVEGALPKPIVPARPWADGFAAPARDSGGARLRLHLTFDGGVGNAPRSIGRPLAAKASVLRRCQIGPRKRGAWLLAPWMVLRASAPPRSRSSPLLTRARPALHLPSRRAGARLERRYPDRRMG